MTADRYREILANLPEFAAYISTQKNGCLLLTKITRDSQGKHSEQFGPEFLTIM